MVSVVTLLPGRASRPTQPLYARIRVDSFFRAYLYWALIRKDLQSALKLRAVLYAADPLSAHVEVDRSVFDLYQEAAENGVEITAFLLRPNL